MKKNIFPATKSKKTILALGAESAGNFSIFHNGCISHSEDFGDLLKDESFLKFKYSLDKFLKKEKLRPNIILTDLHPSYRTTALGQELSKKYKARHIQVQHHIAHIFSQLQDTRHEIQDTKKSQTTKLKHQNLFGVALDGTGYGLDGKIWGGEILKITNYKLQITNKIPTSNDKISEPRMQIERIGHLENQVMIGGELAIKEPARMLIAILAKIPNSKFQIPNKFQIANSKSQKDFVYGFIRKHYSRNEFELLYNQLDQNFNCVETSSAGRILDAVSVLLGFAKNERKSKHEATFLLEKNSTEPYSDIKPKIEIVPPKKQETRNKQ